MTLCSLTARAEPLHVEDATLMDERGGSVLLRGLNLSGDSKLPPFRAIDRAAQLDVLPGWGVNVARVLFSWEAFEAERGSYDESYFSYYEGLLDALDARGVRAIVDFHQDAFSRYATKGCGDGMPRWALGDCVRPATPDNGPACASWGIQALLDPGTARCFSQFYADKSGARSAYLDMLRSVAQRLRGHPAVIGYDMLNEPGGDEATEIAALYADAAAVIREQDPAAILFVCPGVLSSAGLQTMLPKPAFDNFVYAPHYYDAAVSQLKVWLGGDLSQPFAAMLRQAGDWQVPLFIGEFGAPADGQHVDAYIDAFYEQLDRHLVSAAQWNFTPHWTAAAKDGWNMEDFSIVDDQGMRPTFRVRPYAARIAGRAKALTVHYDAPLELELTWTHDPQRGETLIFAPKALFGGSVAVQTSADARCAYKPDARYLECTSATAGDKRLHLRPCEHDAACSP